MRNRVCVLALVAAALLAAVPAVPAAAQAQAPGDLGGSPVPSTVELAPQKTASGYIVTASAQGFDPAPVLAMAPRNVYLCAQASRRERRADGRLNVVSEIVPCEAPAGYRFDPADWTASVRGTFPTMIFHEVWERAADEWRVVSVRESRGTATIDLSWRGVGDTRVTPSYWAGLTYALPPGCGPVCVYAEAAFSRDAIVRGTMRFRGVGVSVPVLPRSATGTMTWWA